MTMPVIEGNPLSSREAEALGFLAQGMTYEEVAVHMGITHSTARSHIKTCYTKLGVHNALGAVVAYHEKAREARLQRLLVSFTVADRLNGDTQDALDHKIQAILEFIDDDRVREELGW